MKIKGWVARYDQEGRRGIHFLPGCFDENDNKTVPVVSMGKNFATYESIIGEAILTATDEGLYCEAIISHPEQILFKPKSFGFFGTGVSYVGTTDEVRSVGVRHVSIMYVDDTKTSYVESIEMEEDEMIYGFTHKEIEDTVPSNAISRNDLKKWQKDIMEADKVQKNSVYGEVQNDITERGCIMSREERQEFLKPKNDITEKAKLQKNSLYGKAVREDDPVNHPSHYTDGKIEVIDFIEDKNLNFHLANAVKYISRAGKKDPSKEIEDLKKARWYLDRYIQKLESDNAPDKLNGSDTDGDEWRYPFPTNVYIQDGSQINKCENKED